MFPQVVLAQISRELGIDDRLFVIGDVGTIEKLAQGFAERRLGHSILVEQHVFQIDALLEGVLHRFDQIALADEAFIDQQIEGARVDRSAYCLLHRSMVQRMKNEHVMGGVEAWGARKHLSGRAQRRPSRRL